MSRLVREGTDLVYEAAQLFVDRALRSDDSLFTPGVAIWQREGLEDLYRRLIENPDWSGDTFVHKLERQLQGATAKVYQLMAELIFMHLLMPRNIGGESKRRLITQVLSWSGIHLQVPENLEKTLNFGIAAGGMPFKTGRPQQIWFLIEFTLAWKKLAFEKQQEALNDPWLFKEILFSVSNHSGYAQREAILHLVFPETFEPMVSRKHKEQIVQSRLAVIPNPDDDVDRHLLEIRRMLAPRFGNEFTFYDPGVKPLWDTQSNPNEEILAGSQVSKSDFIETFEDIDFQPPAGYRAIRLKDIADLQVGIVVPDASQTSPTVENRIGYFTAHDLKVDGDIQVNQSSQVAESALGLNATNRDTFDRFVLRSGDILIPAIAARQRNRIGIVPEVWLGKVTFDRSLIRVRVDSTNAKPEQVFAFLQSDTGQLAIQRASVGSSIPRLSTKVVGEITVFLPDAAMQEQTVPEELSAPARAIREITSEVLPLLREVVDHTGHIEGQQQDLEYVSRKLQQLATTLVPTPISETVTRLFPTPIAVSYRRFHDSRFDVYKQVLQLRDLYEATTYFIYNTFLADYFHRLDRQRYTITSPHVRRAYDDFSMAHRISFVNTIRELAQQNNGSDLFMPEFLDSRFVEYARKLQNFRNDFSHEPAGDEDRLKGILNNFKPIVHDLLSEIDFLANYVPARVLSMKPTQGKYLTKVEIYQGVVSRSEEFLFNREIAHLLPDETHLFLISPTDQMLNLYPFYQLASPQGVSTKYELAFFKDRRDQKLRGLTVETSLNVELGGGEVFSPHSL